MFIDNVKNKYLIYANSDIYFHGSPRDHGENFKVLPYGLNAGHDFGGVFLSKGKPWGHIGDGKNYWYYIELKDDSITDLQDLWQIDPMKNKGIKDLLDRTFDLQEAEDKRYDHIWEVICEKTSDDNLIYGWDLQTLQGQIAKELGYQAIALRDERGRCYLLLGPAVMKKMNLEQE